MTQQPQFNPWTLTTLNAWRSPVQSIASATTLTGALEGMSPEDAANARDLFAARGPLAESLDQQDFRRQTLDRLLAAMIAPQDAAGFERVRDYLQSLGTPQLALLVYLYIEGRTLTSIGWMLGLSPGAVANRILRMRYQLKQLVQENDGSQP